MNRTDYLQNRWAPYPPMPANATVAGRLSEVSEHRLSIQGKGSWSIPPNISFPIDVLQVQDIVALAVNSGLIEEIVLLAPNLESPLNLSSNISIQKKWFEYLTQIRNFFVTNGFQESQTPTLVTCPGTEPFLDLFSTQFHWGQNSKTFYLPTSPELHLKKMLASGYEKVFEIRPCFRNSEISERHQPEFWMLEWYRAYANLEHILQDTLKLIEFLGGSTKGYQRKSMSQLFQEMLGFSLTPQTSLKELKDLARNLQLHAENFEIWDDVFYLIFIEKIEPFLGSDKPVIVEKYPPSQAALARLTDDGWGARFELYWKGLEICNAFHELNDPTIQEQRSKADSDQKRKLGKEVPTLDAEFFQALRSGMPPSGGIALGLERLFMALNGIERIQDLKVFPMKGE